MTLKSLFAAVLAAAVCVSCGQNQPAGGTRAGRRHARRGGGHHAHQARARQQQVELRLPEAPIESSRAAARTGDAALRVRRRRSPGCPAGGASAASAADVSDVPLAPKDARWTIFCATIADANHVETARGLKAALHQEDWHARVVHPARVRPEPACTTASTARSTSPPTPPRSKRAQVRPQEGRGASRRRTGAAVPRLPFRAAQCARPRVAARVEPCQRAARTRSGR